METQVILEIIGWTGSVLIVWSLMLAHVLRFRWMNFAGAFIATFYNAAIGVWPFAAMNAAITIIDAYWLWRLYREADDPQVYQALSVAADDPFVRHLLNEHKDDVATIAPDFAGYANQAPDEARKVFLLVRGDEAVGVVALRETDDHTALVELDWVKPRFRDFTPGQFVYRDGGALAQAGLHRAEVIPSKATDLNYLGKVGFVERGDRWVKELVA